MKKTIYFFLLLVLLSYSCASKPIELKEVTTIDSFIGEPVLPEKSNLEVERQKKLLSIITSSPTPLKAPDTILRVLILPHVDDMKRLHLQKYVFIKVDDGRWILGDYLIKPAKADKTFEPLKKASESLISEQQAGDKNENKQPANNIPNKSTMQQPSGNVGTFYK